MNHKTALIIFWTLVGITVTSWGITFYAVESGMYEGDYDSTVDSFERNLARTLTITDLFFIPVIIMIPLIGSGFFSAKELTAS